MSAQDLKIESKWPEKLKEMTKNASWSNSPSPDDFHNRSIELLIGLARSISTQDIDRLKSINELVDMQNHIMQLLNKYGHLYHFSYLQEKYTSAYTQLKQLNDVKKQENQSATWNGWKTVFFRALTTAIISAGVLGTYYLAHLWGIPLPMLRVGS